MNELITDVKSLEIENAHGKTTFGEKPQTPFLEYFENKPNY